MDGWENMIGGDMDVCTLKRNRDERESTEDPKETLTGVAKGVGKEVGEAEEQGFTRVEESVNTGRWGLERAGTGGKAVFYEKEWKYNRYD